MVDDDEEEEDGENGGNEMTSVTIPECVWGLDMVVKIRCAIGVPKDTLLGLIGLLELVTSLLVVERGWV